MDNFAISESSGTPIWIQIKNRVLFLIKSGKYKPGEQLPTVRQLAIDLEINYNTVNKVYRSLEAEGIIVSKRGKGTFVAESLQDKLQDTDFSPLVSLCDELIENARKNGMSYDDLQSLINDRFYYDSSE